MIPDLRAQFNRRFSKEAYASFLALLERRCGVEIRFRVAETPIFVPPALLDEMAAAGPPPMPQNGLPPQEGGRDYYEPTETVKQEPVKVGPKIGRNDACPCGSGKKYKNCHGKDAA